MEGPTNGYNKGTTCKAATTCTSLIKLLAPTSHQGEGQVQSSRVKSYHRLALMMASLAHAQSITAKKNFFLGIT